MFENAPADDQHGPDAPRNRGIVADRAWGLNHAATAGVDRSGEEPAHRLDPRVIPIWRVDAATEAAFVAGLALAGLGIGWWAGLPLPIAIAALAVVLALLVVYVIAVPPRRYERWRYEIGETEVDLRHGFLTVTRTRVPMARIQHVDTRRGPLERRRGLATLVVFTAAGARSIPGLEFSIAEQARDRIAALANVRDDV